MKHSWWRCTLSKVFCLKPAAYFATRLGLSVYFGSIQWLNVWSKDSINLIIKALNLSIFNDCKILNGLRWPNWTGWHSRLIIIYAWQVYLLEVTGILIQGGYCYLYYLLFGLQSMAISLGRYNACSSRRDMIVLIINIHLLHAYYWCCRRVLLLLLLID
jgi:hypothetical protein